MAARQGAPLPVPPATSPSLTAYSGGRQYYGMLQERPVRPYYSRYFSIDHQKYSRQTPLSGNDDEEDEEEEEEETVDDKNEMGKNGKETSKRRYHMPSLWLSKYVIRKPQQASTSTASTSGLYNSKPFETHVGFSDDPTGKSPPPPSADSLRNKQTKHRKRKRRRKRQGACCSRTYIRLNLIALLAAAVNLGWAVGETLLVPFLLRLGISSSTAALVWAINPVFGIFLQGLVGVFTDQTGRLKTLALLFSITACIGLLLVAYMPNILDSFYGSNIAPLTPLTVLMFVAFGIADLSHDLILTPGRSLLAKHSAMAGKEWIPRGNAMWSAMSNAGRLLGLTVSILPVHQIPILDAFSGPRIQAVFVFTVFVNAILSAISLITALRAPKFMPSLRDLEDNSTAMETPGVQDVSQITFSVDTHQQNDVDVNTTDTNAYVRLDEPDAEEIDKYEVPTSAMQPAEFDNGRTETGEPNCIYTDHSEDDTDRVGAFNSYPIDFAEREKSEAVLDVANNEPENVAKDSSDHAVGCNGGVDYERDTDIGKVPANIALHSFSGLEAPLIPDETVDDVSGSPTLPDTGVIVADDHNGITDNCTDVGTTAASTWTWADVFKDLRLMIFMPQEVRTIFFLQCGGWFLFNLECFYLTSWVALNVFRGETCHPTRETNDCSDKKFEAGVQWGVICLIAQAVISILAAPLIPMFNRTFGTARVYFVMEMVLGLLFVGFSLPFVQTKVGVLLLAIPIGLGPAIHLQNPFLLVDARAREEGKRATYIAILTTAMVASQLALSGFASSVLGLYHRYGVSADNAEDLSKANGTGLTIVLACGGGMVALLDLLLMKRFFRETDPIEELVPVSLDETEATSVPVEDVSSFDSEVLEAGEEGVHPNSSSTIIISSTS